MAAPMKHHHIISMPYPGRGHINPMINFCASLASGRHTNIKITIILTEEWLDFLKEDLPPDTSLVTIPNVLPSELVRGSDHAGFLEAVSTKMEEPVEKILDGIRPLPHLIVADTFLPWAVSLGKRKDIPVASFWPASASCFSSFYHHELLVKNQHYPTDISVEERIDYIPGISSVRLTDLPDSFQSHKIRVVNVIKDVMFWASKAQFILFRTLYDLEAPALDALRSVLPPALYTIGPAIPYAELSAATCTSNTKAPNTRATEPSYLEWLNNQPKSSVLFVSMGSFLSTTPTQLDELAAGLRDSGVSYLWVAREEAPKLKLSCGEKGMVIPWCDQIKVLSHISTGGFLTHCGWNSTLECAFAGVPALTFPLTGDQPLNSKVMVEDWKIGWRLKDIVEKDECLITSSEILGIVRRFMELESIERKELDKRCKEFQQRVQIGVSNGKKSKDEIERFLADSFKC